MSTIEQLSQCAERLESLEQEIKQHEESLAALKKEHNELASDTIPSILSTLGIAEIKLSNGDTLTTKQIVNASFVSDAKISKAKGPEQQELAIKQQQQIEWLKESGNESLIKNVVTIQFSKGENDSAESLQKELLAKGMKADKKADVATQTLQAFFKRRLEDGDEVPFDLFNVSQFTQARIQRAK